MYQVRTAARTDLDVLQDIERAASVLFPPGRLPDPDDVMPMAELETASVDGLVLVALHAERVVGFAVSRELAGYLHLAVVAVHPDHGRRGVGTRLVGTVIEQARSLRLQGVTLTTFRDLPWNAPFYAKLGFRILDDSELNPQLREILETEARLGMTDRVAMSYAPVAEPAAGGPGDDGAGMAWLPREARRF